MYERDKINDGKSLYDKIYFSVLFCVFLHLYIDVYINLCGERLRRLLEIGISNFDVCFDLKQGKNPSLILIFCGPFAFVQKLPELKQYGEKSILCHIRTYHCCSDLLNPF